MQSNLSKISEPTQDDTTNEVGLEAELWQDFKSGDAASFALIYQKFFPILFSQGLRTCHDTEIVKDCIQDLFVYIWNHRSTLSDTNSIKYYLWVALKRRIYRAMTQQQNSSPEEIQLLAITEEGTDQQLITEEINQEKKEQVYRALQALTKRQRQAVQLKFFENLKNEEIAERMSIRIEAVYNLISKSLILLRKASIKSILLLIVTKLF
ncbi:MAG: sigma-70 family RNA polymerase sigma factor [Bacteroidota bacterium]